MAPEEGLEQCVDFFKGTDQVCEGMYRVSMLPCAGHELQQARPESDRDTSPRVRIRSQEQRGRFFQHASSI